MRLIKYALIFLILGFLIATVSMLNSRGQPTCQGKTLRQWLRGHPKEYFPAVQAMGTNAIPWLLSELQAKDSFPSSLAQEAFRRFLDSSPPWETARSRRYHARIGLQVLDTNAVPALLDALFQQPFRLQESHITWESANAFNFLSSPQARAQVREALNHALQDEDIQKRRSACLAFYAGFPRTEAQLYKLVELSTNPVPLVRAASTRALMIWRTNEIDVLPALIARLDDPQVAIRRLAIDALTLRKTNALPAVPALLAAYTNELTRASLSDDVDDFFQGVSILKPENNQSAILQALRVISPGTPLPAISGSKYTVGPNP